MTARRAALLIVCCWSLSSPGWHGGTAWLRAQTEPAEAPDDLRFRKVFAPAERVDEWPLADQRYVPVAPQEFDRLVESIERQRRTTITPGGALLTHARYEATLEEGDVLRGTAHWSIEQATEQLGWLPLEPCNLALHSARWDHDDAQPRMGLGADGRFGVLVSASGELAAEWTMRGRRDGASTLRYQFMLPTCAVTTIELELPARLTPTVDVGVVLPLSDPDETTRHWRIQCGGQGSVVLVLSQLDADREPTQLALVKQSAVYDLSPRGLELTAQLELDVHYEPLSRINLMVDPGLRLASVRYGEQLLRWTVSREADDEGSQVTIELPEPVLGSGRTIRLSALAPLVLDEAWRLPGVRVAGLFWQEGRAELRVQSPLTLHRVRTDRCRQSSVGPLSDPLEGESLAFQFYDAEAGLEIVLERETQQLEVSSGTSIELSGDEMIGQALIEFRQPRGERFALAARVGPRWIIDSVESLPAEALADWYLETNETGDHVLRVELAEPLSAEHPLRLRVTGRSLTPPLETELRAPDLRLLDVIEATPRRELVSVRSKGAYQLRVSSNDDAADLDPSKLAAEDLALFVDAPREMVFELGQRESAWSVQLTSPPPRFVADVQVDVTIDAQSAVEAIQIRGRPNETEVAEVLIGFWPPRAEPWRWASGSDETPSWEAHRLNADELVGAGFTTDEEIWQIRFARPATATFELRATRETNFEDTWPVTLAYVPEASEQTGLLRTHAGDTSAWTVETTRLRAVPPERAAPGEYATARATYRYQPERQFETLATIRRRSSAASPAALVWSMAVDSRYGEEGHGWHVITYRVQNSGRPRLALHVPPHCEIQAAWIDGEQVARQLIGSRLLIDLPARRQFPIVEVHATTLRADLRSWDAIEPPALVPQEGVPLLAREWNLWLPPGFRLLHEHAAPTSAGGLTERQRLFGSLARGHAEGVFLPWLRDDWLDLFGREPRLAAAHEQAEQMVDQVGQLAASDGGVSTWGELVASLSVAAERAGLGLLIDQAAWTSAGMAPHDALPSISARSIRARGLAVLAAGDLALWLHPSAVVLTSTERAAQYQDELAEFGVAGVSGVLSGGLSNRIQQDISQVEGADYVPAEVWLRQAAGPWQVAAGERRVATSLLGYRSYRLDRLEAWPTNVPIVRYNRMVVLGWGAFLGIVAWNWWRPRGSGRWLVGATLVSVLVAMYVPAGLAPLASGTLLGLLAAIIVRLLRRHVPWGRSAASASSSGYAPALQPALPILVWLALAGATLSGHGAEADQPHLVFVPIDENQQPTGDYYLVPEPLQRELSRRAAAAQAEPQAWLLENAKYEGRLAWDLTQSNLVVDQWRASFDVQVFSAERRVSIPLGAEAVGWYADVIRLDGSPIEATIDGSGMLAFDVAEPGRYRLDIVLQPVIESNEGLARLMHSIPPLAQCQLELRLPINSPRIELDTALGEITTHDDGNLIRANLGPTNRLAIHWRERSGPQRAPQETRVAEMLWLRLQPGAVVLQARFAYDIGTDGVRQLQLTADPRLRMLPLDQDALPVAETRSVPGNPQTIHIELSRPLSGRLTLNANFLLTGASGIGNLRLPRLEAAEAVAESRHLAVSIDSSLEFDPPPPSDAVAWDAAEFAAAWGAEGETPQLAYHLPGGDVKWSIATRPIEPVCTATESLALGFDRESVEVRFGALLTASTGAIFQHELQTPPEMVVESVSVREDKVERLTRWSRDDAGRMVLYLAGPLNGSQELELRGRMASDLPGEIEWPDVRITSCRRQAADVQIYRRPDVRIEGLSATGFGRVDDAEPWYRENELGRLVAQYRWDAAATESATGSARLLANDPGLAAIQLTTLERREGAWLATVDCRLLVTGGVVDALRWSVPADWNGALEIEPPVAWQRAKVVGQTDEHLVVYPQEAIEDRYRIVLRAPVQVAPGERLAVPRIELLGAGQLRRYLVLPTQLESQQVAWAVRGAQAVELPAEIDAPTVPRGGFEAYEVVGDQYDATIQTVESQSGLAQVHLADVQVTWPTTHEYLGLATFDIEPAGVTSCPLRMGEGCRLLQVTVDDVPAFVSGDDDAQQRIELAHARLPQRVQVLFSGTSTSPAGESRVQELQVPVLGDLPVERTVWSVYAPQPVRVEAAEPASTISAMRHELLQLENAAALIDMGTAAATGDRAEDLQRWYATASRRFSLLRSRFDRFFVYSADETRLDASEELAALDQEQQRLAQRWNAPDTAVPASEVRRSADQASDLWDQVLGASSSQGRYMFQGGKPALRLRQAAAPSWSASLHLLTVLGLTSLGVICLIGFWKKRLGRWSARWAHLMLAAAGIFWWLWLWPSAVGLVIVACAAGLAMRSSWEPAGGAVAEQSHASHARRRDGVGSS